MLISTLTVGVFLSVLTDNLLLTVVVPILPEFLREKASTTVNIKMSSALSSLENSGGRQSSQKSYFTTDNNTEFPQLNLSFPTIPPIEITEGKSRDSSYVNRVKSITESCFRELFHLQMLDEDSKLGLLFSTKAIVQLISNPFVGRLTARVGYKLPLCIGNAILFLCALAFGFADSYILLLIGRSCHGLASALVAISGMALIAELYPVDVERTVCMGRVMGAAALGVLIGYPSGGFFYAFVGKLFPFLIIAGLAFFNTLLCGYQLNLFHRNTIYDDQTIVLRKPAGDIMPRPAINVAVSGCWALLKDKSILIISLAIWFSTMAIAVLEPTLPMWLIETIDPPKWQLGLVFVPDSVGYFIGTTFFGQVSLQIGRWKASMISMITIGVACLLLPFCNAVWQLTFPHFALGLGLGVVDASLMPLLACLADHRHNATSYGSVYALAQTSVALAYSLGPLLAGQLVRWIGFPDLIRSVGFLNLIFSPFIVLLTEHEQSRVFGNLMFDEQESSKGAYCYHDLSSSTTSSSMEDLSSPKMSEESKKVRFDVHINNEKFPLTAKLGHDKRRPCRSADNYNRLYNELDSD